MNFRARPLGRALIGLGLFFICGCNLDYYMHLAVGQSQMLSRRTPISTLLSNPDLADRIRNQLDLIQAVLDYAASIGLDPGDNYTTFYDTGDDPVIWGVSASPPDRFEAHLWNFPIVGSVPYKGFFEKDLALKEQDTLRDAGLDALVRPVNAYSTLGFFSDPILSVMLKYQPDQLADLILHELTHVLAYAPDHTDYNESLATFVGRQGSMLFLAQHLGPDTPLLNEAQERRVDSALFRQFMIRTVASLDSLYSSGLAREVVLQNRQSVFEQRKRDFAHISKQFIRTNYDGFLEWPLNNAKLLSYHRYNTDLDLFSAVHQTLGNDLAQSLRFFANCAAQTEPWSCINSAIATRENDSNSP